MDDTQDIINSTETEKSFEELLNQSDVDQVQVYPGEKVEAVVVDITEEWIFINYGGKAEGFINIDEFKDDEGNIGVKVGDSLQAFLLSSKNNEMLFTTRLTGNSIERDNLRNAFRNGIPIEGVVEKEIKGGYEVKIAGNIKAFCPYSYMGLFRSEDSEKFQGQSLTFKIVEFEEKGRNIIVSNKVILEEERKKQKDMLRSSMKIGMTVSGEITAITKFGAFVDIGGIEGLIPISEISWGRVEDINTILSIGQKVDIVIKTLDWENDKYSFSLKELIPDPWSEIESKYPEESIHKGKVSKLTSFGAFVTLEPGIDGLIHISDLGKGKRIMHPREVLKVNRIVEVKVGKVDKQGKRISLELISGLDDGEETEDYRRHLKTGEKESSGSFGTLGDLLKEKLKH